MNALDCCNYCEKPIQLGEGILLIMPTGSSPMAYKFCDLMCTYKTLKPTQGLNDGTN